MLKGKKVKTNDGKDIGEIKQVSQNFLRLEKGTVKKDKFWIPKYVADAYDGNTLWLLASKDDILDIYHHGFEPSGEQYTRDFEVFRTTPYGQKAEYQPDYEDKVRLIEDYKNMRSEIVIELVANDNNGRNIVPNYRTS
jgi:hypothetical protein